ncbi:MAG: hypothetical protein HQL26_10820 [Candidatus Omnitrophica bacterium]|nr:hypothetical protein [Candidatus Omnitrophota bacterium]
MKRLMIMMVLCMFAAGCCSVPIKKGMTKAEVQAIWGRPDSVKTAMNSCDKRPNEEAWHYYGMPYRSLSLDKSVLFRDDKVEYVFRHL